MIIHRHTHDRSRTYIYIQVHIYEIQYHLSTYVHFDVQEHIYIHNITLHILLKYHHIVHVHKQIGYTIAHVIPYIYYISICIHRHTTWHHKNIVTISQYSHTCDLEFSSNNFLIFLKNNSYSNNFFILKVYFKINFKQYKIE